MDIAVEERENTVILTVTGNITMQTSPNLHKALTRALGNGAKSVLVDLAKVKYTDSSGVGVLVSAMKIAREKHASLALVNLAERVTAVFELTGLLALFKVFDDMPAAIEALG